jgi:NAD(P)-dependent dehydrogenase (short-subunit alcohol dehydrogenase family)
MRAVVTGAASGIGRGFARELAAAGHDLVLWDVNGEGLAATATEVRARGVRVDTAVVDVSDGDAVEAAARAVLERGPVDLLVNNAGVGVGGMLADTPRADWERVVAVNLMGVVHGCRAFIPAMRAQPGRAHVVNIASASGYLGTPGLGAYSVTKNAVRALSEVLHFEEDPARLAVHCVCPGFVGTGILDGSALEGATAADRARIRRALFPAHRTPEDVARATLRAMRQGRFLVPVFREGVLASWVRHLPMALLTPLGRRLARRLLGLVDAAPR